MASMLIPQSTLILHSQQYTFIFPVVTFIRLKFCVQLAHLAKGFVHFEFSGRKYVLKTLIMRKRGEFGTGQSGSNLT